MDGDGKQSQNNRVWQCITSHSFIFTTYKVQQTLLYPTLDFKTVLLSEQSIFSDSSVLDYHHDETFKNSMTGKNTFYLQLYHHLLQETEIGNGRRNIIIIKLYKIPDPPPPHTELHPGGDGQLLDLHQQQSSGGQSQVWWHRVLPPPHHQLIIPVSRAPDTCWVRDTWWHVCLEVHWPGLAVPGAGWSRLYCHVYCLRWIINCNN